MEEIDITHVISKLKRGELTVFRVPNELSNNQEIINVERELGIRKSMKRGFDVIRDCFFVEELLVSDTTSGKGENKIKTFYSFEDYYEYLAGDIYENACYKYCASDRYSEFAAKKNIDIDRMLIRDALICKTIDDLKLGPSEEELLKYDALEKEWKYIYEWINKFDKCKSGVELENIIGKYNSSKYAERINYRFFLSKYIFKDVSDCSRFDAIMEYISINNDFIMAEAMCLLFSSQRVLDNFRFISKNKRSYNDAKREIKRYIESLNNEEIKIEKMAYFDERMHCYCEVTYAIDMRYRNNCPIYGTELIRYFDTFEELLKYRNGDLRRTDLSKALKIKINLSQCITDYSTKLPPANFDADNFKVEKQFYGDNFYVKKIWSSENEQIKRVKTYKMRYFFDFAFYLHGNMADADLVSCDGLVNLPEYHDIDFNGARLSSILSEKYGVKYDTYSINEQLTSACVQILANEKDDSFDISFVEHEDGSERTKYQKLLEGSFTNQKISYVSDIHLLHQIKKAECRSWNDIDRFVRKIVDVIYDEAEDVVLIGGDISSDINVFKLFVIALEYKNKYSKRRKKFIFVLGNHEFWGFQDISVAEIVNEYRNIIDTRDNMFLLHNDVLYRNVNGEISRISKETLDKLEDREISELIRKASLVILGGVGFSGYNTEFNANQGVYLMAIDSQTEIEETKIFEKLYDRMLAILHSKNTIILTHMPKKDWHTNKEYDGDIVYVCGHTHKNYSFDDDYIRIYADNQIGYKCSDIHLKKIYMNSDCDYFGDYLDGIYRITKKEYLDFNRGKNRYIEFTRQISEIYMLKKNGYYCFIAESSAGSLCILNGGELKGLKYDSVEYYYINMEKAILVIQEPYERYMSMMENIAQVVKMYGGVGRIHGCIIDIDWYNHLYVNPFDLKITPYWAMDMINKTVYPDFVSLIKEKCPEIYNNYVALGKQNVNDQFPMVLIPSEELDLIPREYRNTDIYLVSKIMNKVQKLKCGIICIWPE